MLSSQTIGLGATGAKIASGVDFGPAIAAYYSRLAQSSSASGGSALAAGGEKAGAPAADNTILYVGIGAGVLAVAGLAWYLTSHKHKGRRRR